MVVEVVDPVADYCELMEQLFDFDGLRALFTTWITAPQPDLDALVPAVLDGAVQYVRSGETEFAAEAKTLLKVEEGCTTAAREWHLDVVRCIGCCGMSPAMVVDGKTYGRLNATDVPRIIALTAQPKAKS